mmetsp:Transcript_84654/g.264768  ORF Transcript_84654/g.264768 Transcript_84654/m.264768 type:complete len:243 (-) Transcript_84654:160-888(-)
MRRCTSGGARYMTKPSRIHVDGLRGSKPAFCKAAERAPGAATTRSTPRTRRDAVLKVACASAKRGSLTSNSEGLSTSKKLASGRPSMRKARVSIPAPSMTNCRVPWPYRSRTKSSKNFVRGGTTPATPPPYPQPSSPANTAANGSSNRESGLALSVALQAAMCRPVSTCGSNVYLSRPGRASGLPASSNKASIAAFPRCRAFSRGISPSPFRSSQRAPCARRTLATATCPCQAARCSGVGVR